MHRTSGRILLIVAAFALFLVPVAAIAAGGFTDVEDDSVFIADIQWMKDNGVTAGCNPPTNDKYCPKNNVTREQMSAFMHRLAVNQIVDAATAIEAENADTLDGKNSTAFAGSGHNHDTDYLAIDGKADDADTLDGKNSSAFISGASWETRNWTFNNVVAGGERTIFFDCPGLKTPIAGGGQENGDRFVLTDSTPYFTNLSNRGWMMSWQNESGSTKVSTSGKIWVLCADVALTFVPVSATDAEVDPNS